MTVQTALTLEWFKCDLSAKQDHLMVQNVVCCVTMEPLCCSSDETEHCGTSIDCSFTFPSSRVQIAPTACVWASAWLCWLWPTLCLKKIKKKPRSAAPAGVTPGVGWSATHSPPLLPPSASQLSLRPRSLKRLMNFQEAEGPTHLSNF